MNESTLETVALDWLKSLDYTIAHGPDLSCFGRSNPSHCLKCFF